MIISSAASDKNNHENCENETVADRIIKQHFDEISHFVTECKLFSNAANYIEPRIRAAEQFFTLTDRKKVSVKYRFYQLFQQLINLSLLFDFCHLVYFHSNKLSFQIWNFHCLFMRMYNILNLIASIPSENIEVK